jgi:chromosome partitioning protein
VAEHGKTAFPNSVSHQRQVRTYWLWYYIMSRYTRTTLSAQDTKLKLSRNGRLCPIELPASEDIKRAGELGLGVSEIRRAYGSKEARGIWEYVRHELGL